MDLRMCIVHGSQRRATTCHPRKRSRFEHKGIIPVAKGGSTIRDNLFLDHFRDPHTCLLFRLCGRRRVMMMMIWGLAHFCFVGNWIIMLRAIFYKNYPMGVSCTDILLIKKSA